MKSKIVILLCLFLVAGFTTESYGQKQGKKVKITGTVEDSNATPVADAIIMLDGERTEFVTDSKGYYKIKIGQDIRKIGIATADNRIIEELIDGRTTINFKFQGAIPYRKAEQGQEVVDIGYGKVRKDDVLAPVGTIDGTKSKYSGYNNIYEMIRGQVPGVVVSGTSIMIRSANSINEGTEPLFVVDGVPVNTIDNIYPQMVKSISILKGSAASIYGTRGSNGVILINLMKGYDK